jgi:hypothetical protein
VAHRAQPRRGGRRLTAGSATVARLVDEDEPRNTLPTVERREEADEHASSKPEDAFDAMGLALAEARAGPRRSMDVPSADKAGRVDPSAGGSVDADAGGEPVGRDDGIAVDDENRGRWFEKG